jgi:hypothetical protein
MPYNIYKKLLEIKELLYATREEKLTDNDFIINSIDQTDEFLKVMVGKVFSKAQ